MSEHMAKMKGWIDSFPADINALLAAVGEPKLAREARLLASAALSYLVLRLDLIPDWEETAGILDDAMVLRVAAALASVHDLDPLEDDAQVVVHRLANESDVVKEFLGDDLYLKLKTYVGELTNTVVRGRHPRAAVDDARVLAQLSSEVKDELKSFPPAPMKDPEGVARTIRNYLSLKLK